MRTFAALVDEVNGRAVNDYSVLIERVDGLLGLPPVEPGQPIVDQLFHVGGAETVEHVFVVQIRRPASIPQALLEIIEDFVGHVDGERLERGCCCHGIPLSVARGYRVNSIFRRV